MFNVGVSELIILAIIGLPALAFLAAPVIFGVILWKKQTELSARLARLEASLRRSDS
jgi:hypothetical protein